jgi:hypothetical protein
MLGVGVRAEVLRTLLTIRAHQVPGRVITDSAAFAQRNVREGLAQLLEARVITSHAAGYSADVVSWAALLGFEGAPALPFHFDWIRTLRALTAIHRWLQNPELDDLSPYLRASRARTLTTAIERDLASTTAPLDVSAAHGMEFWDAFVEVTRATVRSASGQGSAHYGRRPA